MTVKIKLINVDDDMLQDMFNLAKVDSVNHEGYVKALDEIPDVIEIDCFKLPNEEVIDLATNIVSAFAVSKWMVENNLKLTDNSGNPLKE